jgi:hypothetical protein
MQNRRGIALACAGLLAGLALAGCSGSSTDDSAEAPPSTTASTTASSTTAAGTTSEQPAPEDETLTVGWIFAGSDSTDAVATLESEFEGRVDSVVETNAADGAAAAEALISQGAELVLSEVAGACTAVPDVPCVEPPGGSEPGAEAVTLGDAFWTRAYLLGRAAGLLTESDNIGFLAGEMSPEQTAAVNAFALGCQSSDNNCLIRLVVDPTSVRKAIRDLRGPEVDILATTLSGEPLCRSAGDDLLAVQPVLAPGDPCGRAFAVASLADVAQPLVQAALDGNWQGGRAVALPLGEWSNRVPQEVATSVEDRATEIEQGRNVFVGPLFDNQGERRVPEGEALTPDFLASGWDWLLGGVFEQQG